MTPRHITVPLEEWTYDELPIEVRTLVDAARQATARAYAPYSQFHVGAAIRLADGTVITGSNQENAAYPSGLCAERTAAFYAGANHPNQPFREIAIAAVGTDGKELSEPVAPCGACRQSLLEYEKLAGHDVPLWLIGSRRIYRLPSVASSLPLAFSEF